MSDTDIERALRAAAVGERPTWPVNAPYGRSRGRNRHKNSTDKTTTKTTAVRCYPRSQAERDACRVMALTPPLSAQELKRRYRQLAKAHHPDSQAAKHGAKNHAESCDESSVRDASHGETGKSNSRLTMQKQQERFKTITAAYALLQVLCRQAPLRASSVRGDA